MTPEKAPLSRDLVIVNKAERLSAYILARQLKAQVEAGTITTEAEVDAAAWPTAPGA